MPVRTRNRNANTSAASAVVVATIMHDLIDQPVVDQDGRTIGRVSDSVFNGTTGKLTHLVLVRNGSTIYLPWRALQVETTGNQVARLTVRHRRR